MKKRKIRILDLIIYGLLMIITVSGLHLSFLTLKDKLTKNNQTNHYPTTTIFTSPKLIEKINNEKEFISIVIPIHTNTNKESTVQKTIDFMAIRGYDLQEFEIQNTNTTEKYLYFIFKQKQSNQ